MTTTNSSKPRRFNFRATFRQDDGSTTVEENDILAECVTQAERLAANALRGYRRGRLIGVLVQG